MPADLLINEDELVKRVKKVIINDCEDERIALPCLRDARLKGNVFWMILKDLVGKDISKYSMPVILNEPLTILQKYSE